MSGEELQKLRELMSELMKRSCSAMFEQSVWSKQDHRLVTRVIDSFSEYSKEKNEDA